LIAAMLLASPFHVGLSFFQNSVLWSLVAELIFYSLYPFLRVLHARFGWNKIIVVSYAVSFAAIGIFNPSAKDYAPSGNALNWLICLPYWLLGCRLAEENFAVRPAISGRVLWQWRLGVALAAWTCNALRFHSAIGYPWSLGVFAILLFFWLRVEITAFCCKKPFRLLEWAGQWSYSIYLMHLIAVSLFGKISLPDLGIIANWILTTGFVLVFCYAFYLLIEKPSHGIARWAGKALRKPSQVILPPSSGRPVPAQSTSGSLRSPD
jgi:peptidoglycan/LPS O-acetylase OafA/YrhL